MRARLPLTTATAALAFAVTTVPVAGAEAWKIHDRSRPKPPVIAPAEASTPERPGRAPSDAVVLFDGTGMDQWRSLDGSPAGWLVKDGALTTVKGKGPIRTVRAFGDCQLHVEWATPVQIEGNSQGRGNSGVILMGQYEVQVLDSFENVTYADGQAAAIYAQAPPQVNASRRPGEWQTYDIVFRAPRFAADGTLTLPARLTVLHNGVLVQDAVELSGPTGWMSRAPYRWHPAKLPLTLQDHGNPVRYRNIWVRELPAGAAGPAVVALPEALIDSYVGEYRLGWGGRFTITRDAFGLLGRFAGEITRRLHATSETTFVADDVDLEVTFQRDSAGKVTGMVARLSGEPMEARRAQ